MFFTKMCPSGGTKCVSFELSLGILRGPDEGRGGAPGTVPLQNPQLGCRKWGCNKWGFKGCLTALPGNRPKSAEIRPFSAFFALFRRA